VAIPDVEGTSAKDIAERIRGELKLEAADSSQGHGTIREWGEHLALLARWLYRDPEKREGELVQADYDGVMSSRRLANAALRLLASGPREPS